VPRADLAVLDPDRAAGGLADAGAAVAARTLGEDEDEYDEGRGPACSLDARAAGQRLLDRELLDRRVDGEHRRSVLELRAGRPVARRAELVAASQLAQPVRDHAHRRA